jgi:hypothetical protein
MEASQIDTPSPPKNKKPHSLILVIKTVMAVFKNIFFKKIINY